MELEALYADQRAELTFRRNREQQVFLWTAGILLAITGGTLAIPAVRETLGAVGPHAARFAALAVLALSTFSVIWQLRQRECMRTHQRVLAQLALRRGWFDELDVDGKPLIPEEWAQWGTAGGLSSVGGKVFATAGIGLAAAMALWLTVQ